MCEKDIIVMSREELRRLELVRKVLKKELTQVAVADVLGLSNRQVRRIVKRMRREGDRGIAHQLREGNRTGNTRKDLGNE